MIVLLEFLLAFGVTLSAAVYGVRRAAHSYPFRTQPVVTEASTEALEAWLDAYNAVLDPYSATIEDIDARACEALAAADKTLGPKPPPKPPDALAAVTGKRPLKQCVDCGGRIDGKGFAINASRTICTACWGDHCALSDHDPYKWRDADGNLPAPKEDDGLIYWEPGGEIVFLRWQGLGIKLTRQEYMRQGLPSARDFFMKHKHPLKEWDAQKQAFIDGTEIERAPYDEAVLRQLALVQQNVIGVKELRERVSLPPGPERIIGGKNPGKVQGY